MDDIEYLEEYEGLIMPGGATEGGRTVGDDESSSSLDQDLFDSLFEGQSDDEGEILPKKINERGKQRQVRESLDSLDMLVRDLGEQVGIETEHQKGRSINESSSMPVNIPTPLMKPMTPCLKKSVPDGIHKNSKSTVGQSHEKQQKSVMFADLPMVKRCLSSSSSTSSKINFKGKLEKYSFSGRKPIHNKRTASDVSKGSDSNSERKLNRPQLTIVRPEKIQFKDPVDDPLSLEKVEPDSDSLSDISDDSYASLSEIYDTSQSFNENENRIENLDPGDGSTKENIGLILSSPTHISTADLPEKVTIISDTVLSRIDTALLESLATDESKELFSREQKTVDKISDSIAPNLKTVQTENSAKLEPDTNETIPDCVNIEQPWENTSKETSDEQNEQINEPNLTEENKKTEQDLNKSSAPESDVVDNKHDITDAENRQDNFVEIETTCSKEADIQLSTEKSEESDQNSNIPDITQTVIVKERIDSFRANQSNEIAEKKIDVESKAQESVTSSDLVESSMGISRDHSENVNLIKDSENSENSKKNVKSSEKQETFSQTNKNEKSNLPQTTKKVDNLLDASQKFKSKKVNTTVKIETEEGDQKTQQTTKTIVTTTEQRKEVSKEHTKDIVNQSRQTVPESSKKETKPHKTDPKNTTKHYQKTKDQQSKEPQTPESLKKEPQKSSANNEGAKKKNIQKSETRKENTSKTQGNIEKKDLNKISSSPAKHQQARHGNDQSSNSNSEKISAIKDIETSSRKCDPTNVAKKQTEKVENPKSSHKNDIPKEKKYSRESSNFPTTSTNRNKDPTHPKEKRDISAHQKTTPQTQRKLETKQSTPKKLEDNKETKKGATTELNSKEIEDKQRKKQSKKEQTQKVEERKKPNHSESKMENTKVPKEIETSKMKSSVTITLKDNKTENRSKEHTDHKKIQPNMQKQGDQLEKHANKMDVASKRVENQQTEQSTVNNSPKKDVAFANQQSKQSTENNSPKKDVAFGTFSSSSGERNNRSEATKPPLKRENSMSNKTDNSSTKRLRSTSSSAEDAAKLNKSSESDLTKNTKEEETSNQTKPSSEKEDTNAPNLLNRKNSNTDLSRKDETLNTNQSLPLKISKKDHQKSPVKNLETTSALRDEKNKSQNKPSPSKTDSLTASNSSITRSNKTSKRNNDLPKPLTEVHSVTKKLNTSASHLKKIVDVEAPTNLPSSNKPTMSQEKSAATPTHSTESTTSNIRKNNKVSTTTVDTTEEDEVAMKRLSPVMDITAVVSSISKKEQQHVQSISSTSVEDKKMHETNPSSKEKADTKVLTTVPLSNEPNVCSSESNFNNEQHIAERKNRNNSNSRDRKQNKKNSVSVPEKKTSSKKDSSSEKNIQPIHSDEPTPLKTASGITDVNKQQEQENTEKSTDSISGASNKKLEVTEGSIEIKEAENSNNNVNIQGKEETKIVSITEKVSSEQGEEITEDDIEKVTETKNAQEMESHSTTNRNTTEIVKKVVEANTSNILKKRSSATERKTKTEMLIQHDISIEIGSKRQLRKRCIETSPSDESDLTSPKASIDKRRIATSSNLSKETFKSTMENSAEKKQAKKEPTRKSRRGRETEITETTTIGLINNEVEKTKTPRFKNVENQQNNEASTRKASNYHVVSTDNSSLDLKDQIEQATETMKIATVEQNLFAIALTKELIEPASALQTEISNEILSDSNLDSLSMTSVESAAFSGFANSPVNVSNNEKSKSSEAIVTASKSNEQHTTTQSSKDENAIHTSSSKSLKSGPTKPATTAVITFNEWLARKNNGQSIQEKSIENKESLEASKDDSTKENSQISNSTEDINNASKENETKTVSETTKISPTNLKPHPRPQKKSEIELLKESMSKEMRESGIDNIMERHFSSPHCLTKRSLAARKNNAKSGTTETSPEQRGKNKTVFVSPQISTHAKKITSPSINVHRTVNVPRIKLGVNNTKNIQKDAKHSVKNPTLLHKCRKLRIRINRSVVKLYFQNLKNQATNHFQLLQHSNKPNSSKVSTQIQRKARGKKRKAKGQIGSPSAKKAFTKTLAVPAGKNAKAITPSPLATQKTQTLAVRYKTSSRAKIMTIAPRSRSIPLSSASSASTTAEQTVLPEPSRTSPTKSGSKSTATETDLLTPISEALTPTTRTDNSRRAISKRSSGANTSTTTVTTAISSTAKVPRICSSPTLEVTRQTQLAPAKQSVPLQAEPLTSTHQSVAPKTECEDEYDAAYRQSTSQSIQQASQTLRSSSSVGHSSSRISPALSTESRVNAPTVTSTLPLVISGATSHSLPPVVIDNAGTRIYSFLHPTKYNNSHGFVMLDYCCPNLDGPMTAIDPTRRHAKVDVAVRELPAYITMETRLVTRAELEADSNSLPASIRHKVQRITGSKGPSPKVTPSAPPVSISSSSSSILCSGLTSSNVTLTTTVPPKATTALVSSATSLTSSSIPTVEAVSASVSALQKQLPSTTTLTPKTMPSTTSAAAATLGSATIGGALSAPTPTATITPTTMSEMRLKLRNNLKKYDILLKKHYPRISLLSFTQRQKIIESVTNATQLLPRDIETATRLLQEYVTHMALTTATKSQSTSETSTSTTASVATVGTVRASPTISIASTTGQGTGAVVVQKLPPVTTRANSKRTSTANVNYQQRSVPIYNSNKAVIGYQVQMVNATGPETSASTREVSKTSTVGVTTSTSSTTTTRRSGVFVIDKTNVSAATTTTQITLPKQTAKPRMLYHKINAHTPTSIATMVHTPQATSTPLLASGSIVTRRSGMISRIDCGVTVRQVPTRSSTSKLQSTTTAVSPANIPTTSTSPLPRLPTLTRNPHLPPLSGPNQPTTPLSVRSMSSCVGAGMEIEQSTLQKRLTRKTATTNVSELLVVNHDSQGNPLPLTDELILPHESSASSGALIKSENPDEF